MASSNIGNIAGIMGKYVREGLSARQAVARFREAGGRISNQAFRSGYAQVRDSLLANPTAATLPGHLRPGLEHFSEWQTNTPGQYAYQVELAVWDKNAQIGFTREWTIMSDEIISPANAIRQASEQAEQGAEESELYKGQQVVGGTLAGLYVTTSPE